MHTSPESFVAAGHGDHLCLPYETEHEHRAALIAFVRDGLRHEQRCMVIAPRAQHDDLAAAMEAQGVPATRAIARGALVLTTNAETYLRTGRFSPDDMLAFIDGQITAALAAGFTGFRGTGEVGTSASPAIWQQIVQYEALLNERFARRPFVALCRYRRDSAPAERVADVLRTHPLALLRGEPCGNPFYERAQLAVSADPRDRLDWQLRQVRVYDRTRRRLEAMAQSAAAAAAAAIAAQQAQQHQALHEVGAPLAALERELNALRTEPVSTVDDRLTAAGAHLRHLTDAIQRLRAIHDGAG